MLRRFFLLLLLVLSPAAFAADAPADPFADLRPFVGKTFRGEGTGTGKMVDVQRWEWAVGGHAVRIVHALEDGSYGGETVVFWDKARNSLIYHYFTTAGFHTQGSMVASGGKYVATEKVEGHPTITEVRSTSTIQPDGTIATSSEYLDNGTWVQGHAFLYREAPGAVVNMPQAVGGGRSGG